MLVEDTCLAFDALGGMPGPYVKWFLKNIGAKGLHNMLAAFPNKKAQAICTLSYCDGTNDEIHVFQGVVEGEIVEPRGNRLFDNCFLFYVFGTRRRRVWLGWYIPSERI